MISFNKIILHNFASYEHAEVELSSKGFCLVTGKNNYKKDNALSNGSGKSMLWSGICFTLTGETISGIRTDLKNIMNDENSAYTTLFMQYDADEYEITRYIAPKTDLKIIKNGVDVSGKGIRESTQKLGELLPELTRNLIGSCIIIGQGMPNKFSAYSPSGRKELLEKLTKCDFMIDDIKQRVDNRLTKLSADLRECEDKLLINRTNLANYQSNLSSAKDSLKSRVKPDFKKNIDYYTGALNEVIKSIETAKLDKDKCQAVYETANAANIQVSAEKSVKLQQLNEAYYKAKSGLDTEINSTQFTITTKNAELQRLRSITDICPTCKQKLFNIVKPDTSGLETELKVLNETLISKQAQKTAYDTKYNTYLATVNTKFSAKLTKAKNDVADAKKKLTDANNYINELTENKHDLQYAVNDFKTQEAAWDSDTEKLNITVAEYQKKITDAEELIKVSEMAEKDLQDRVTTVKKIDTLVKRDFRGYLLSNIITYLDAKAKDYCNIVFGTKDLNIYLDGNALDISYCDKMFDNLSGGEKQRVDLILQFAIRDMLSKYLNFSANILVLDEITDFLDRQACKAVMSLIENELNAVESVFIISHHSDELDLPIDSELHVNKSNTGISTVTA